MDIDREVYSDGQLKLMVFSHTRVSIIFFSMNARDVYIEIR